MKKIILFIFILIIFCSLMQGQTFTNITATLTDSNGQVWTGAQIIVSLQRPFGNPAPLLNQGIAINDSPQTATADNTGTFSLTLDDNAKVTPSNSRWQFIICPNATVATCTNIILFITGASMNLSASLSNSLIVPVVNAAPAVNKAYNDNEVIGGFGGLYWRTSDNTLRGCVAINASGQCTTWSAIVGTSLFTNAGVFTNGQMNEYLQSIINNANPLTEYQALQGPGKYATDAISGAISVPVGSVVLGSDAVAGYINNSSINTNALGILGQARCLLNNTHCWGANYIAFDVSGLTTGVSLIANESDTQPQNAPSAYNTVIGLLSNLFSVSSGTFSNSYAYQVDAGQNGIWANAYGSKDAKANNFASIGAACAVTGVNTCGSQPIFASSSVSGVRALNNVFSQDSSGNPTYFSGTGQNWIVANQANNKQLLKCADAGTGCSIPNGGLSIVGSQFVTGTSGTGVKLATTNSNAKTTNNMAAWAANGDIVDGGTPFTIYTPAGSAQGTAKAVFGTGTLSVGSSTVTLAGSAQFTSNNTANCVATDTSATNAVRVSIPIAAPMTSFTVTGTGSDGYSFICIGN